MAAMPTTLAFISRKAATASKLLMPVLIKSSITTTVCPSVKAPSTLLEEHIEQLEKDLESVVYLIKNVFFVEETEGKTIHYYQDPKGLIWLNFDYNDKYPGNKYQSDIRESEVEI